MKLDHITAVVADADAAAGVLERLLGQAPIATLALPGMAIRSFKIGDAEIHVNAPTGPGPVDDHMKRHGPGYHHLALRVEDVDRAMIDLAERGFSFLGKPVETAPGLREVFVDPRTAGGMMIQLVERRVVPSERYDLDGSGVEDLVNQLPGGDR